MMPSRASVPLYVIGARCAGCCCDRCLSALPRLGKVGCADSQAHPVHLSLPGVSLAAAAAESSANN